MYENTPWGIVKVKCLFNLNFIHMCITITHIYCIYLYNYDVIYI